MNTNYDTLEKECSIKGLTMLKHSSISILNYLGHASCNVPNLGFVVLPNFATQFQSLSVILAHVSLSLRVG